MMSLGMALTARRGKGISIPPVKFNYPVVALLGPSTTHRNNAEATHLVYNITSGPHVVAKMLDPRIQVISYYNAGDPLGRNFVGSNYGLDSDPISNQITRIAAIKAGRASIVDWNSGRGAADVFAGQTVAGYCNPVKAALLDLKSSGKTIIWENLWNRHTLTGGDWASGGPARTLVQQINAEMAFWCSQNGIIVADVYTIMTDLADPDLNPKAGYYSSDGIHYSGRGAYRTAKYYVTIYAQLCQPQTPYDNTVGGNLWTNNPTLTGTGGLFGNSASGVVPDNYTLARGSAGNARACVGSIGSIGGKNTQIITLGAGSVPAAGEGLTWRASSTLVAGLLTPGTYVRGRLKVRTDGWAGWSGIKLICQDGAATPNGGVDNGPGTGVGGNVPLTGFSGSDQYPIVNDAEDWYLETPPFLVGNTDCTFRLNATYLPAAGNPVLTLWEPDIRVVPDPSTVV